MVTDLDHLILREMPDAVMVMTPDGEVVHWSNSAEALFGYSREEATGSTLNALLVPAEKMDEEDRYMQQTLDSGYCSYESVRRRKDATFTCVDISNKAIHAADGVRYVLSNQKDVTELKITRDAKLLDGRFRELLESMPDAIVIANQTGHIIFTNSQAETLFGYSRGELCGCIVNCLLPERFRTGQAGQRFNYLDEPRKRAMGADLNLYGMSKNGEEFPIEISLSPMDTEEGPLVVSAIRDISERKRIERSLHEKNIELKNANLAKDRFLAGMSHELRTPLNAIIGFTGTLLMKLPGPLTPDQERQLRTVQTSARHLLSLINDLLDVAKIESGKVELQFEPVMCQAVLAELADTMQPLAAKKGLKFTMHLPTEAVVVATDRRALSQILINLVSNAIKFTDSGEVAIRLETTSATDGNVAADFTVIDTGAGIEPADQEKLFQAFTQLDASSPRRFEGTGLGLYLSQKLAGLIEGQLSFKSEVGLYSAFTLRLKGTPQ